MFETKNYLIKGYIGVVTLGGLYGMLSAIADYTYTLNLVENFPIKMYEPVINACIKTGHFVCYNILSFLGSAFIVATMPISIPFTMFICGVKLDKI